MTRVAIIGPGLLGGSLALALAGRPGVELRLWGRRMAVLDQARALGIEARMERDVREAVRGADVVVLCVPVGVMPELVFECLSDLGRETLVTDVGSVKAEVVAKLAPMLEGRALFVGSHPMAGSEKTGLEAARADLFEGAVCLVTPEEGRTSAEATTRATLFWRGVGCEVRELAPGLHDAMVARISHVPHVVAAGVVNAVGREMPGAFEFCGPGFRDTTRVASGSPSMWTEILRCNRREVVGGVREVIGQLEEVAGILERLDAPENAGSASMELDDFLSVAKQRRDALRLG